MLIRKLTTELISNSVLSKSIEVRIAVAMASDWAYERLNPMQKLGLF